jgi:hypothetical protein
VLGALMALDFPPLPSAIAAAIAMATSPAVVLLAVQDQRAEGQVTERALNLTALNSLIASILVTILLASAHYDSGLELETVVLHPLYLFLGSVLIGRRPLDVRAPARAPARPLAGAPLHADRGPRGRGRGPRADAQALRDPGAPRLRPLLAQRRGPS